MMCHLRWWELRRTTHRLQTKTRRKSYKISPSQYCLLFGLQILHTHKHVYVLQISALKKVAIGHSMTDRPHGHHFLYFLLLLLLFKLHRYYKSKEVHRRNGKGEIKWGRDSLAKAIKKAYIIRYKLHSRRQKYIKYILSMHIVVAVYKRIMIHEVVCKQHAASKIATKQKKCKLLLKPFLSK